MVTNDKRGKSVVDVDVNGDALIERIDLSGRWSVVSGEQYVVATVTSMKTCLLGTS